MSEVIIVDATTAKAFVDDYVAGVRWNQLLRRHKIAPTVGKAIILKDPRATAEYERRRAASDAATERRTKNADDISALTEQLTRVEKKIDRIISALGI